MPTWCRRCGLWRRSIHGTATARFRIFLERQGHVLGTDRMYRLWRQEGLQVPKKRPRRRVATSRPRPLPPTAINHVWAYDFVFDTCANGQTLKCLTIIDEFTRECLAIDVAGGIRSARVIEVLTQLVSVHGAPRYLRSDNGPEFVARAILRWLQTAAIETAFIDPGKPWQNGSRRILQREVPRSALVVAVVSESRRSQGQHRSVASPLQRRPAAFESRLFDARRVQSETSSKQCPALRCQNRRHLVGSKHGA
jgi:transposase InsO family protein